MLDHPNYEILETIGQGPNTVVYRARNLVMKQDVAVKVLTDDAKNDPDRSTLLMEAAAFSSNLRDYGNILQINNLETSHGWLILELMKESLARRIQIGPLPLQEVYTVLRSGLRGLSILHQAGRVHGRIKPTNLLINDHGRVKIADSPGLFVGDIPRQPDGLPKYIAPEIIDPSFGKPGPASDLYSLAFTVFELLKGPGFDELFKGTGTSAIDPHVGWQRLHTSRTEVMPSVGTAIPGTPADLVRVLDRLLKKQVDERYKTAEDALRDLGKDQPAKAVDINESITAPPSKSVEPSKVAPPPIPAPAEPVKVVTTRQAPPPKSSSTPSGGAQTKSNKNKLLLVGAILLAVVGILGYMILGGRSDPEVVKVQISSNPAGAEIAFDGKEPSKKKTNETFNLAVGKHKIVMKLAGHETIETEIDTAQKKEFSFDFKLVTVPKKEVELPKTETFIEVAIKTDPPGAKITLTDPITVQPQTVTSGDAKIKVKPGMQKINVEKDGFVTAKHTIEAVAGMEFAFNLTPVKVIPTPDSTFKVSIESEPVRALVTVNGMLRGNTPVELDLKAGDLHDHVDQNGF